MTREFDGEELEFANRDLSDLALAYALTSYRTQGSQARTVVISLVDAPNVDSSLISMALTRVEEGAIFIRGYAVFERALARVPAFERRVTGCRFELDFPR